MIGMWMRDIVLFITDVVRGLSGGLAGCVGGSEQTFLRWFGSSVVVFEFQ